MLHTKAGSRSREKRVVINADEVQRSLTAEEIVDAVTGIGRLHTELVLYNTPIISVQFSCAAVGRVPAVACTAVLLKI